MLIVHSIIGAIGFGAVAFAGETADQNRLTDLHQRLQSMPLVERIEGASRAFLGMSYLLDPAGEGADSLIDQDPVLRLDAFDCQTYVETVLAVARAKSPAAIDSELRAVRYRAGRVTFGDRRHFPEIDWIPANTTRGVLRDITQQVAAEHPLAEARTQITRAAWLLALPNNPTQARNEHLRRSAAALAELQRLAQSAQSVQAVTRYITKTALADPKVLDRIPHGSIIMIVRPMTSMFGKVGSRQNISHMGFAIRTPDGLMYRHASSTRRKAVVDRQLDEYLGAMNQTRSFAGIVVFEVLELQN